MQILFAGEHTISPAAIGSPRGEGHPIRSTRQDRSRGFRDRVWNVVVRRRLGRVRRRRSEEDCRSRARPRHHLLRHRPGLRLRSFRAFHRDIEAEILPYAAQNDIGVLVYGPLAHGLLSGTMTPRTTFAADDWRGSSADFKGEKFARDLELVERLKQYAASHEITLPQLAVAWTISNPAVDVAIVGARHPSHLDDPVAAADIPLSALDRDELDAILLDPVEVGGPAPEGLPV